MRFHPILHFARMHTGVDWGAPIGTPIFAAGNGVVIKAGWDSGYGRRVEIQHANGYVTTYNHMSGFGRGVAEGAHVTQGQVVGYLGQSGLATGPHLHYEVIINGNFVDPMAIKLARTREFDGKMLAAFKRERDRIDQLMVAGALRRRGGDREARRRRDRQAQLSATREGRARRRRAKPSAARIAAAVTPFAAQRGERRRAAALRQLAAVGVEHEAVVAIARRRQAEQRLQQAMDGGRGEQIAAAHDVGDALKRVVDRHRQMIARGEIPAAQDDVAPGGRVGRARRAASRPRHIRATRSAAGARAMRPPHVEPPAPPCRRAPRRDRAFRAAARRGRRPDRAARRRDRAPAAARATSARLQKQG